MKLFFRTLWRNAKRVVLGILGIALFFAAIWFCSSVLIAVCNALKLGTEWLGALVWEHKWVAVLVLAIIGGTIVELIEIVSRRKRIRRRNQQANQER